MSTTSAATPLTSTSKATGKRKAFERAEATPSGAHPASEGKQAARATPSRAKGKGKAATEPGTKPEEVVEDVPPVLKESGRPASPSKPRLSIAALSNQEKQSLAIDWGRRFEELETSVAVTDASKLEDGEPFLYSHCFDSDRNRGSADANPRRVSPGTLVWARASNYHFYPAEMVDPDAEDTPDWAKMAARSRGDAGKIAVMYFDDARKG